MSIADFLNHTCTVQRNVSAGKDPDGNPLARWNNWIVWVKCRLIVNAVRELDDDGAQQTVITEYSMFLPSGTDVNEGDRITDVVIEDDEVIVEAFDVESVKKQRARKNVHHIELELKRIG